MLWVGLPAVGLQNHHTRLVFACALQLCKLLDKVFNADVFHILFKFLMNLQNSFLFFTSSCRSI